MSQWETATARGLMVSPRHTLNVLALLLLPILCLVGLIALADLLVCCIVMPLSILVEVRHGVWTWNVSMCLLYVYSDVFLCSASIVHMSVISLDRYLGISKPLRTRNKSRTMIFTKISFVWLITLVVSCPIAVLAMIDDSNILRSNSCMIFSQYYIIYGSTLTFLIPFCIMVVTYVRTTNLLNKQASILSQKANDKMNGNGLRRTMPHRKLGYVRTNSATANGFTNPAMHKASGNSIAHKASFVTNPNNQSSPDGDAKKGISRTAASNTSNRSNGHKSLTKTSTINKWKSRTSNYLTSIAMKVSRRGSIQAASQELANEHKATRVLAVVFVCFFICWTPFFATNFILGFCGEACALPPWLGSFFLWMGYMSSTINPIIYTVFNKRFRHAFVRILRCQCFHSIRETNTAYSRNYTTVIPDYTWSNHERVISLAGKEDNHVNGSTANGSIKWHRQPSDESQKSQNKPPSPPDHRSASSSFRGTRATTEETSDEDTQSEQRPLLTQHPQPQRIFTTTTNKAALMKKSFTTLLTPTGSPSTAAGSLPKSVSCVDCPRCSAMVESSDTDTMTSSINSCSRHYTLFSSTFGKSVKETFL